MNDIEKYDPEDLEQLMRERKFEQLLEEEKAYVLRHMSGPEEYEQVRRTLLAVAAHMDKDVEIEPDPDIKQALMSKFANSATAKATAENEEKGGFTYWLNSVQVFLLPSDKAFYGRPAYQLAFATVLVLIGFFFMYDPIDKDDELALEHTEEAEVVEKETDKTLEIIDKEEAFAKNEVVEDSEEVRAVADEQQLNNDLAAKVEEPILRERKSLAVPDDGSVAVEDIAEENWSEEEFRFQNDQDESNAQSDGTYDVATKDSKENEVVVESDNAAGAASPATISTDSSISGQLAYSAPTTTQAGNAADVEVTNQMVFENESIEEVQISAEKSKSRRYKSEARAPLKSANMRQYGELIGLLHTTL